MLRVGQYELRSEGGRLVYSRLVGGKGWDGIGEGYGIGGFWTGKLRSHCGMEGGGNVVLVRGQHEGKGSVLPGRIPHL